MSEERLVLGIMTTTKILICEVCNKNEAMGVYSVPAVPISCSYCRECLEANAHPWYILVGNTSCLGGLEHSADWWKEMVEDTCKYLGRTIEEFNKEVEESVEKFDKLSEEDKANGR